MCNSVRRNFANRWVGFSRIGKYFVGGCLASVMPHSCRCRVLGKTTLGRMPSKLSVFGDVQVMALVFLFTMVFFSCKNNPTTGMSVANRIPARRCYCQNCQASVCHVQGAATSERRPVIRCFCWQVCNCHCCFKSFSPLKPHFGSQLCPC